MEIVEVAPPPSRDPSQRWIGPEGLRDLQTVHDVDQFLHKPEEGEGLFVQTPSLCFDLCFFLWPISPQNRLRVKTQRPAVEKKRNIECRPKTNQPGSIKQ